MLEELSKLAKRAFPNAYVRTDELPSRSIVRSALCAVAVAGISYLGVVILTLSLFSVEYNPITQFASDYGVGTFALEMNTGFFSAGVGVVSLGLAILLSPLSRTQKLGAALLLPAGLALMINAFYQTDIEGSAKTFHGLVHGFGGLIFFTTSPVGLILVSYGLGRRRFVFTISAFALAVLILALNTPLALDATGLTERIAILVVFSSLILTAYRVLVET